MDLNDTANLSNYALTSTVSSISANLQNQINQLAPISTIVTGISSSNIIVDTTNTFNTFGSGEWLINANNGISSRTSKILANWNSFGVTFTESSTTDLSGSTNNLIFDMDNVASTIRLKATSLLGNWTIKFRKDIL
jgi:hypothetical protein